MRQSLVLPFVSRRQQSEGPKVWVHQHQADRVALVPVFASNYSRLDHLIVPESLHDLYGGASWHDVWLSAGGEPVDRLGHVRCPAWG